MYLYNVLSCRIYDVSSIGSEKSEQPIVQHCNDEKKRDSLKTKMGKHTHADAHPHIAILNVCLVCMEQRRDETTYIQMNCLFLFKYKLFRIFLQWFYIFCCLTFSFVHGKLAAAAAAATTINNINQMNRTKITERTKTKCKQKLYMMTHTMWHVLIFGLQHRHVYVNRLFYKPLRYIVFFR